MKLPSTGYHLMVGADTGDPCSGRRGGQCYCSLQRLLFWLGLFVPALPFLRLADSTGVMHGKIQSQSHGFFCVCLRVGKGMFFLDFYLGKKKASKIPSCLAMACMEKSDINP